MGKFRAYTLKAKDIEDLPHMLMTISINAESMGPPEATSLGIEKMWRCSDANGALFVLWTIELNEKSLLDRPPGTVWLEVWPPEKGAKKRKQKDVLDALGRIDQALSNLGATKCR